MDNVAEVTRFKKVWKSVSDLELDALLVTHLPNVFYLTGLRASAGAAILSADGIDLIVDFRYMAEAVALKASERTSFELRIVPVEDSYDQTIRNIFVSHDFSRVGVESDSITLRRWSWFVESLSKKVKFFETKDLVEEVRLIKDSGEIEYFRVAGLLLASTVKPIFELVHAGRTEREVAADIDRTLIVTGFENRAFETMVASGPNSARPHSRPQLRRLSEGDIVVLDFGGVYNGYCVDLSRTICVGRCSSEAVRLHQAVLHAQSEAINFVRPGVLASDVDGVARRVLESYGLAEAFGHGTGHGLGLEVHEGPKISRCLLNGQEDASVQLQAGMVFTVEPGVYIQEVGGVRIEDDILVTPEGSEILTEASRALIVR